MLFLKQRIGGVGIARALRISPQAVSKWRRVPDDRLFELERSTGVAAEALRPDLVNWIRIERQRRLLERAKARFAFGSATAAVKTPDAPASQSVPLFDLGLIVAAQQFAARARGLTMSDLRRDGQAEKSARAYGVALAFVVGRVTSGLIAATLGMTRQNVENIGNRYLRARDGDEADDWDDPDFDPAQAGYVMERGRRRRAKGADDDVWQAERRFLDWLEGVI